MYISSTFSYLTFENGPLFVVQLGLPSLVVSPIISGFSLVMVWYIEFYSKSMCLCNIGIAIYFILSYVHLDSDFDSKLRKKNPTKGLNTHTHTHTTN